MKVLIITHGTLLDDREIVSGNSVRAHFLAQGLVDAGISVVHCHPRSLSGPAASRCPAVTVRTYADRQGLARVLDQESPDVILVGYWELLEDLPAQLDVPVVLDVVAPRVLEVLYQDPNAVARDIARMKTLYPRADRFLVGNERQRVFLVPWLLLAGFDLREHVPVDIIPISLDAASARQRTEADLGRPVRFVTGGVTWPWRRAEAFFDRLVDRLSQLPPGSAELHLLTGTYVYGGPAQGKVPSSAGSIVKRGGLLPYRDLKALLRSSADIGLEVAETNIEREMSQSFRMAEFLEAGLPVIISAHTELAGHVADYDAGWVVEQPSDLDAIVADVMRDAAVWAGKSRGACRLAADRLDYRVTTRPLVDFVRRPSRAPRLPRQPRLDPEAGTGWCARARAFFRRSVESMAHRKSR